MTTQTVSPPEQLTARRPTLLLAMWQAATDVLQRRPHAATGEPVLDHRCEGCGASTGQRMFGEPVPNGRAFEPVQCESCALVAIHPMPARERLTAFYEPEYYGQDNRKFGGLLERAIGWFRRARVRAVRRAGVERGRVLDIGCARGLFLAKLQQRGFEVFGVELSPAAARGAIARLGADRVQVCGLLDADFEAGTFDAITAWQVFEHLPDPHATLTRCHQLLKPGGVVILAVPNIDSWQARWAGAMWFHLDVPRHLFHYSPTTLSALLAQHGFAVEAVSHHNLEQNPFGLLQSALHRLGRPFCGLYDALRGARGRRLPATVLTLLALPFAIVVSVGWSLLGSGATFTVRARRR